MEAPVVLGLALAYYLVSEVVVVNDSVGYHVCSESYIFWIIKVGL
jgi:hypothetical protein